MILTTRLSVLIALPYPFSNWRRIAEIPTPQRTQRKLKRLIKQVPLSLG